VNALIHAFFLCSLFVIDCAYLFFVSVWMDAHNWFERQQWEKEMWQIENAKRTKGGGCSYGDINGCSYRKSPREIQEQGLEGH